MRTGYNLGKHRYQTAKQIEDQIATPPHGVFDFWTKGSQENHVADDVRPAAVHERRGQNSDPVMAGNDLGRNRGPLYDECITTHQLKQKYEDVHHDNDRSDHRQSHRTSRGIA